MKYKPTALTVLLLRSKRIERIDNRYYVLCSLGLFAVIAQAIARLLVYFS